MSFTCWSQSTAGHPKAAAWVWTSRTGAQIPLCGNCSLKWFANVLEAPDLSPTLIAPLAGAEVDDADHRIFDSEGVGRSALPRRELARSAVVRLAIPLRTTTAVRNANAGGSQR
jgi:hypothetical protein